MFFSFGGRRTPKRIKGGCIVCLLKVKVDGEFTRLFVWQDSVRSRTWQATKGMMWYESHYSGRRGTSKLRWEWRDL